MKKTLLYPAICVFTGLALMQGCVKVKEMGPSKPMIKVEPGASVLGERVNRESGLIDPLSPLWNRVQEYQAELAMAPPVHPSVALRHNVDAEPIPIYFRTVTDDTHFRMFIRWPDPTENTYNAFNKFSDGAALQFALSGGRQTPYMMGAPGVPVNIWYWKGGSENAQNLNAVGFGTTTLNSNQDIQVRSHYSKKNNGEWNVVFSRILKVDDDLQANLKGIDPIQVSFAVWQGEEKQRDGLKRTSIDWITIKTDKTP